MVMDLPHDLTYVIKMFFLAEHRWKEEKQDKAVQGVSFRLHHGFFLLCDNLNASH